jgi:hypothetical protein
MKLPGNKKQEYIEEIGIGQCTFFALQARV